VSSTRSDARRVRPLVQIAVPVILIGLGVWQLDMTAVGSTLVQADLGLAAGALFLLLLGQLASGMRWRALARILGVERTPRWFIGQYLRGCFYNSVLPTGLGGDAIRIMALRPFTSTPVAVKAVTADRISGLLALALIAAALFPLTPYAAGRWPELALGTAALGTITLTSVCLLRVRMGAWLCWTALFLSLWCCGVWLLALALKVELPIATVPTVVLVVGAALAIPASIGGVGTREAGFVMATAPLAVSASSAVALGVAFGLALTVIGLAGAPLAARSRVRGDLAHQPIPSA